jgi:hypothetical protein
MELHLGTNYLACYLLTLRLLPFLRQAGQRMGAKGGSQDARVVMVSSKLHELGSIRTQDPQLLHSYTAGAAYAQSKLAQVSYFSRYCNFTHPRFYLALIHAPLMSCHQCLQVMLTAELRRRIPSAWNVGCYSLHPGNVMTDVVRTLPVLLQKAYRFIMRLFLLTTSQGTCPLHSCYHLLTGYPYACPRPQHSSTQSHAWLCDCRRIEVHNVRGNRPRGPDARVRNPRLLRLELHAEGSISVRPRRDLPYHAVQRDKLVTVGE